MPSVTASKLSQTWDRLLCQAASDALWPCSLMSSSHGASLVLMDEFVGGGRYTSKATSQQDAAGMRSGTHHLWAEYVILPMQWYHWEQYMASLLKAVPAKFNLKYKQACFRWPGTTSAEHAGIHPAIEIAAPPRRCGPWGAPGSGHLFRRLPWRICS